MVMSFCFIAAFVCFLGSDSRSQIAAWDWSQGLTMALSSQTYSVAEGSDFYYLALDMIHAWL
jgi:hypothetical protein